MATRTFKGGAPETRLSGGLTGLPATFTVVAGTGYPTVGPFVVAIDRGLASEEKILCASRSGNVFTITTRGFDDTASVDHSDQAKVEHTIDAAILTILVDHTDNGPVDPHNQYLNTTRHDLLTHAAFSPPGGIIAYGGASAPTGWLLCDGASLLRSSYPALFTAIGTTYGFADGTHFNVPNLKGRVAVGRDAADTDWDTLGETRGAKTHTLTTAELAVHTHIQDAHGHNLPYGNGTGGGAWEAQYASSNPDLGTMVFGTRAETPTNQNTGSGTAHNNLQPSIVLNYIIKT